MSIVLTLPPELASELTSRANDRGLSLSDFVLQVLQNEVGPKPAAKTGAELLTFWRQEGLIGTRTDITDSAEHAREIRQKAEKRQ